MGKFKKIIIALCLGIGISFASIMVMAAVKPDSQTTTKQDYSKSKGTDSKDSVTNDDGTTDSKKSKTQTGCGFNCAACGGKCF